MAHGSLNSADQEVIKRGTSEVYDRLLTGRTLDFQQAVIHQYLLPLHCCLRVARCQCRQCELVKVN